MWLLIESFSLDRAACFLPSRDSLRALLLLPSFTLAALLLLVTALSLFFQSASGPLQPRLPRTVCDRMAYARLEAYLQDLVFVALGSFSLKES